MTIERFDPSADPQAWYAWQDQARAAGYSLGYASTVEGWWLTLCPLDDQRPERVIRAASVAEAERVIGRQPIRRAA